METNLLFQNEQIITESENKLITLTTHRIRYNSTGLGTGHLVSMMLDKVSSIEVHYKSSWVYLIISAIFIAAGFVMGMNRVEELMIAGIIIGLCFALLYIFSRKHVVSISSDGGAKIHFHTKGMKREKLLEFINKIEETKMNY